MAKKKIACIYKIVNIKNKKFYLGSTLDFETRKKSHLYNLRHNKHRNQYLQHAYNKYGKENFVFKIFKKCNKKNSLKLEQYYLDNLDWKNSYNISGSASGGDLIKNHPDREKLIANATRILIEQNRSPAATARRKAQVGDKNPNFGKRWNNALKKKVGKIVKDRWKKLSKEEREKLIKTYTEATRKMWNSEKGKAIKEAKSKRMKGKGNHFFGKKHSKKSLKQMAKVKLGKENPTCHKSVTIEGVIYKSMGEAALKLKKPLPTVHYRCYSTNPKFKDWNITGETKDSIPIKKRHNCKRYKYKDQVFDSINDACRYFNKSSAAMRFRARSKDPKWKDYSLID